MERVTDLDFPALARAHRRRALRLAWRLCGGDAAAAEDVVQEALVRAHSALHTLRDAGAFEPWLTRIVVRQAATWRRKRAVLERLSALGLVQPVPDPRPAPQGDPALRQRIATALDHLSRGQREAFVLVYMEGWTAREAADILGKAPGTVKSHLARALRSLRSELADLEEQP